MKTCKTCGKQLPDDSVFCQYCGSKEIEEKVDLETENENLKKELNQLKTESLFDYKKGFKVACIICVCLFIWVILAYYSNNGQSQITILTNKVNTLTAENEKYKDKVTKYDKVIKIANQEIHPKFMSSSYFVKGTENDINIYSSLSSDESLSYTVNGIGINASWSEEWLYDGDEAYCVLHITCTEEGSGTIKITNSYNSDSYYIFVTGN